MCTLFSLKLGHQNKCLNLDHYAFAKSIIALHYIKIRKIGNGTSINLVESVFNVYFRIDLGLAQMRQEILKCR